MDSSPNVQTTSNYRVILCSAAAVLGAVHEVKTNAHAIDIAKAYNAALTRDALDGGMHFRIVSGDAYPLLNLADPVRFANDWFESYRAVEPESTDAETTMPPVVTFEVSGINLRLLATPESKLSDEDLIEQEYTSFRLLRLGEIDRLLRMDDPPGIAIMTMLLGAIDRLSTLAHDDDPHPLGEAERFGLVGVDGFRYESDMLAATRARVFGYVTEYDTGEHDGAPYVFGLARDGFEHGETVEQSNGTPTLSITLEQAYADVCRAFVWLFIQIRTAGARGYRQNAVQWLRKCPPITMGTLRVKGIANG